MNQLRHYDQRGQRGALTIFSAALILILMTIVLVYATRVSVFESRVSGNEVRQKEAFHVAEAALDQSMMYLLSNSNVILSSREDVFADGNAGSFTRDGWFAAGNTRWQPCPATLTAAQVKTHPCGGEVLATTGAFYYDTDGDTTTFETLPVNQLDFPTGATARVSALMCFIDLDTPAGACLTAPTSGTEEAESTLMLTLLAYGYSDCTDTADIATCTAEATVALPVSNFKKLAGAPAVPLVTKSTFPPQGTVEVVGNPNAGGVGVPLTTWVKANTTGDCPISGTPITSSGSWQTCEMEEWYQTNDRPEGVACTDNNCMCGPGGNDTAYFLSWRAPGGTNIGIDIIPDDNFPCDLFDFYFGVPREFYWQIKATAQPLDAADCGSLGTQSSGLIWINGGLCTIAANTIIGSPQDPVILVSAASSTKLAGGAVIFGVLYIFDDDPLGNGADLTSIGSATVYGAVIVDGGIDKLQGTFQIVYNEAVLATASGIAGLGSVNGGWRDFGLPDIAW